MTAHQTTPAHPVLACAVEIGAALDRVADVDPVFMPTAAKAAALVELARAGERVRGLLLRVLANADDVALDEGATSAAAWLGHRARVAGGRATAAGSLAEALDARWRRVQAALLAGDVNEDQARVISAALDKLPGDLSADLRREAEEYLVDQAAHFGPAELRVLGRKVLEVIAPEAFDDEERKKLAEEEARAARATRLRMRKCGDGTTDISIKVADAIAGRLKAYLESYASPRRGHLDPALDHVDPDSGERIPYEVLMGRAFAAMLESMPAERLPQHGGSATTVVVTIDFDALRDQVGAAGLFTGDRISAGEAMRLACTASIMPLVLDGDGQPLHLGRAQRFFSAKQRIALAVRDQECRAKGCTIPAAWCEAHHRGKPWAAGGRTDLEDGVLLCPWHHHRAHDPGYAVHLMPNGDVRFKRRT